MQGEFRGDFTRNTYDKSKHFLRVLMQQGRVQLDADWNEQTSILLERLQALAKDLIGPHGGSERNFGFEFIATPEQIDRLSNLSDGEKEELNSKLTSALYLIGKGNYYVDGILCENESYIPFSQQPDFIPKFSHDTCRAEVKEGTYLAYLDVWERHITSIEDNDALKAGIREVALNGADTATRSKIVWQVKLEKLNDNDAIVNVKSDYNYFRDLLKQHHLLKPGSGRLKARASKPITPISTDSCIVSFNSKYRGTENQLYRVEIFQVSENSYTFVWSRNNSSVVFPIQAASSNSDSLILTLEYLERDQRFSLSQGDLVEIVDDNYVLHDHLRNLLKVEKIDYNTRQVTLIEEKIRDRNGQGTLIGAANYQLRLDKHPLLRPWDGAQQLFTGHQEWLTLEDGIEVKFENDFARGNGYRVGDYWLLPVRTATGDVEWPKTKDGTKLIPAARPPHGVAHYYAPLAIVSVTSDKKVTVDDCRRCIGSKENNTPPLEELSDKENNTPPLKQFNRVVNASWHHDQVFGDSDSATEEPIFAVKSPELKKLFTELGLVVEFQKAVRVDSLHPRSVLVLAQRTDTTRGEGSYILPMKIEPVEVNKTEKSSIRWLIGNAEVDSTFNLITEVKPLKNQELTQAVRLIVPEDWSSQEILKNRVSQLTVILRGDWILNEEILFNTNLNMSSRANLVDELNKGTVPSDLREQLKGQRILESQNALIYKEKENKRWSLIEEGKMYFIKLENRKLTVGELRALDGNHTWPGIPDRFSGNGSEGGDWISVIKVVD